MLTTKELNEGLAHFYGTEGYTYLGIIQKATKTAATDGVKWLAENAECYWLIDAITSFQRKARVDPRLAEIQFWTFKKNNELGGGVLTCERDAGDVAFTHKFEFTSFPLDEIKIWVEPSWTSKDGNIFVMMLPSER